MVTDRYIRQKDIVPEEILSKKKVTVIGVGAIGRQVALMLASIGVMDLQLIDFDEVDETNVVTQGYRVSQIGLQKVRAISDDCYNVNNNMKVEAIYSKFHNEIEVGSVIFCCVDSMTAREDIWLNTHEFIELFVDGRMTAEALRVICTDSNKDNKRYYEQNLDKQEDIIPAKCTARTTIYCANIAAGLMVACLTRYLRDIPLDSEVSFNILTNELAVFGE